MGRHKNTFVCDNLVIRIGSDVLWIPLKVLKEPKISKPIFDVLRFKIENESQHRSIVEDLNCIEPSINTPIEIDSPNDWIECFDPYWEDDSEYLFI